ncbi:toll/interleukin-1 receptor domain-containing protein [Mucilaginibacter gossypii]|uniref:TIR domain-containing protein n=3 Tax=Mucilaginibacter TaxID=423349 RepID=A0A1G8DDC0_9SPHI|nr:toll/interleukin-1 receptor domain-containing protein [Mucilaginibacter gossypii]SDH55722.1 TIR domain-containing protein [Mucilaginibacter gossypii]
MINLFISYSHEDERHLKQLRTFLSDRNCPNIRIWDDGKIEPGAEWDAEIKNRLDEAHIVLLLITQTFLNSRYINNVELNTALENLDKKKTRVVPIFVKDCFLEPYPQITRLQGLPDNKRFLSTLGDAADREYVQIVKKINEIAGEMLTDLQIRKSIDQQDEQSRAAKDIAMLSDNRKVFLSIPDSFSGREKRKEFLYVVMGRKQYENWPYEIVPGIKDWEAIEKLPETERSDRMLKLIKECAFAIHIMMTADELDEGFDLLQYNLAITHEKQAAFFSNILWLPNPLVSQELDEKLLMHPTVLGNNFETIFRMIEDKNAEKEARIKAMRHDFAPHKKVYMFYDFEKDHNSMLRIKLKNMMETDKRILINFSIPGIPFEKDRAEAQESEGICLYYGQSNPEWFVIRQSMLIDAKGNQQKMLCIDDPDIDLKYDRDVSKNAFNHIIKGKDRIDFELEGFINGLFAPK